MQVASGKTDQNEWAASGGPRRAGLQQATAHHRSTTWRRICKTRRNEATSLCGLQGKKELQVGGVIFVSMVRAVKDGCYARHTGSSQTAAAHAACTSPQPQDSHTPGGQLQTQLERETDGLEAGVEGSTTKTAAAAATATAGCAAVSRRYTASKSVVPKLGRGARRQILSRIGFGKTRQDRT